MQTANWKDVLHLGLTVFSHESIEIQIAIGLAVALAALMVIEGLRANFFPGRRAEATKPANTPAPHPAMIEPEAPQTLDAKPATNGATQHFAATRRPRIVRNPKCNRAIVRAHKTPRPTIRRMQSVNLSDMSMPAE